MENPVDDAPASPLKKGEDSEEALSCLKIWGSLSQGRSAWLGKKPEHGFPTGEEKAGYLYVATGGTSGKPRFARHTRDTMRAAALGLAEALGGGPLSSWCCLPARHVGGWMQVVRAAETGGDVAFGEYRDLANSAKAPEVEGRLLSLVPTQLMRLLASELAVKRLRACRMLFVGGGPMSPVLKTRAREARLPVAPTYGMTETAGMVTLMKPEDFLAGEEGVGDALPHAELRREEETGRVLLRAKSLFRGYLGEKLSRAPVPGDWWATSDAGTVSPQGRWHILGRLDRVANTGGEKVNLEEVEAAARETGPVRECLALGLSDEEWGERLTLFCVAPGLSVEELKRALSKKLSGPRLPKEVLVVDALPLSEMGKPDLASALRMASGPPA